MLHLLYTQYGPYQLAVELKHVQSVLTLDEANALEVMTLSRWLGDAIDTSQSHVGLVSQPSGMPLGVCLGTVIRFDSIESEELRAIPDWLYGFMPPIFFQACLAQHPLTWLLDLPKLLTFR